MLTQVQSVSCSVDPVEPSCRYLYFLI